MRSFTGSKPIECARPTVRGLEDLARLKSTEFHFILLHGGAVVFKRNVPQPIYDHFLILHTVVRMLADEEAYCADGVIPWCEYWLGIFVRDARELYGEHFISFNVHNVVHSPKDVEYFDRPLYEFSCYGFENELKNIKRMVVTFNHMLEQAVKRIDELRKNSFSTGPSIYHQDPFSSRCAVLSNLHARGPTIAPILGSQYESVTCGPIKLTTAHGNNTVRIKGTNDIFSIRNIIQTCGTGEVLLVGHRFQHRSDFFLYPTQSSRIGTMRVGDLSPYLTYYRIDEVKCKCYRLNENVPDDGWYVVSPVPFYSVG